MANIPLDNKPVLENALKWVDVKLQDTRTNHTGIVTNAVDTDDGIRLIVDFPGDEEPRLVAMTKEKNLECVVPGFGRARYRIRN